jgi:ParB/RepB/Spo0J family partition protein
MPKPTPEAVSTSPPQCALVHLPIDSVAPSVANPRLTLDPESMAALKKSIEKNGLLQPIAVRVVGDAYEILGGHRRYYAMREIAREYPNDARFATIPALVVDVLDNRVAAARLAENINRADLNPLEVAEGVADALENGMTEEELAESLGWGRRNVYRYKQFHAAPAWLKAFATEVQNPVKRMKDGVVVRDELTGAIKYDVEKLPRLPVTHLDELLILYNALHDVDTKELAEKGGDGFRPRAEPTVKKLARTAAKELWSAAKMRAECARIKRPKLAKDGGKEDAATKPPFTITKERASLDLTRALSPSERKELVAKLTPALKALGFKKVSVRDEEVSFA